MEKKPKGHCMGLGAMVLVTFIVVFIVKFALVILIWAWIVPDLFPGAVAQGLVVASVPIVTALKIAFVAAILCSLIKIKMYHRCKKMMKLHGGKPC